MLDSGTKHPKNRIHLYSPSNYSVTPTRQTISYDNFAETTNNNNNLGLRSYNTITDKNTTEGLRSYNESISSEPTNGGRVISHDDRATTMASKEQNHCDLRFVTVETVVKDGQCEASTPQLWRPSSVSSSRKSLHSPLSSNPMKTMVYSLDQTMSSGVKLDQIVPCSPLVDSPSWRTQAIDKGRRELMEMVRDLPETFYELSLKDIVEQKATVEMEMEIPEDKKRILEVNTTKNYETKQRKSSSKKKMVRSKSSVENGKFLLKTSVFPNWGSNKSSRKSLSASSSLKVAKQMCNGPKKHVGEKEWWRINPCISSESDVSDGFRSRGTTSRSSCSSNSSNGRHSNRLLPNFCFFNRTRKGGKKKTRRQQLP